MGRWWWFGLVAACSTPSVPSRTGTATSPAKTAADAVDGGVVAPPDALAEADDAALTAPPADGTAWPDAAAGFDAQPPEVAPDSGNDTLDGSEVSTLDGTGSDISSEVAPSDSAASDSTSAAETDAAADSGPDSVPAVELDAEVEDAVLPTPPGPCAAVVIGAGCQTVDPTGVVPGACTGQWQCNDGGPYCTAPSPQAELCNGVDDDCDGAIDDGAPCSDGDDCTAGDQCQAGACVSGASVCECKQALDCLPSTDLCAGPVQCVDHVCIAGPAVVCSAKPGQPCLGAVCQPATGQCATVAKNEGGACDADGDPCTPDDHCEAGACVAGAVKACDDGNPCTSDACAEGQCLTTPNVAACSDGNACTVGDLCQGGACLPGAATACDDGNVCTADACNPLDGSCSHTLLPACVAQTWQRAIGGGKEEKFYGVVATGDGGYVAAGSTRTWGAGGMDGWIVKVDGCGAVVWSRTFGGAKDEEFWSVALTPDGGFIAAGSSATWPGTFIVKLDAQGNPQWQRVYGGGGYDFARLARPLADGGYLALIEQYTYSSKPELMHKATVMKLTATGDPVWVHTYGGVAEGDTVSSFVERPDGSLVLAGSEESDSFGNDDFWLLKLDSNGKHVSSRLYGTESDEEAMDLIPTSDGGWLLAGKVEGGTIYKSEDAAVLKLAADGTVQWSRRWGGFDDDRAQKVFETPEGYAVMGRTASFGTSKDTGSKWSPSPGQKYNPNVQEDVFFVRLDKAGKLLAMTTYGNASSQYGFRATADGQGGFVLAGLAFGFGNGSADGYLVHVDAQGQTGGCGAATVLLANIDQASYKLKSKSISPLDFGGGGALKSGSASTLVAPVSAVVCPCK